MKEFTKYDQEKPATELLPPRALMSVAEVLAHGAQKYEAENWKKVDKIRRYYGAALRHLFAWAQREDLDPDSGLPHLSHAACCILFILELYQDGTMEGIDDRSLVEDETILWSKTPLDVTS